MIIDARSLPVGTSLETDLCIIGAGAAGITLARECEGQGFRVILLEAGGLMLDLATQSLYDGDNIGIPYAPLNVSRLRYFGGTTNHWSGFCRPLDAIDFEARDWIPYSGWPISLDELKSFYLRAQPVLDLGDFRYDPDFWETPQDARLPLDASRFRTTIFQRSPPTRFATKYKDEIEKSSNVTCYLNANVLAVNTDADGRRVTSAKIQCLEGPSFSVNAKHFVLATGGIENARLLLAWQLGNKNDWVGRCFMEHIHIESGLWMPADAYRKLPFYETHWDSKAKFFPALTLADETARAEKLAGFGAALTPLIFGNRHAESYLRRDVDEHGLASEMIKNVGGLVQTPAPIARDTPDTSFRFFSLFNRTEQTPNRESRITLADKMDALGMPRAQLNWQLNELDKRGIRRSHEMLAEDMAYAGLGRIRIDFEGDDHAWPRPPNGGMHHIGTTRMSADPKDGVVDGDCKIHGMDNFHVAGSSIFPTSGISNPTLTIVALAMRLADHLKETLS